MLRHFIKTFSQGTTSRDCPGHSARPPPFQLERICPVTAYGTSEGITLPLGSCPLGYCIFGKFPFGKLSLGKSLFRKCLREKPIRLGQISSGQFMSGQVKLGQTKLGFIKSSPIRSGQIRPNPEQKGQGTWEGKRMEGKDSD